MSAIQRAYQVELDLNNEQTTARKKHAGAARWAYNWGLQRKQEEYRETGKCPGAREVHRELNALKSTDVPWMCEVSKCAPQEALRNVDQAFSHFFRRAGLKKAGQWRGRVGSAQPKSKKRGLGSFRLTGSITVFPAAIQLPRLGRLRLQELGYLPTTGTPGVKMLSASVSEQAGHGYVSVHVEHEQPVPENCGPAVGVDLGSRRWPPSRMGRPFPIPGHSSAT